MSSVSSVSSSNYSNYSVNSSTASENVKATDTAKAASGAGSSSSATAQASSGVIYEPSKEGKAAAANAKTDRSAIVSQLKEANEARIKQMTDLVQKMISGQGKAIGQADSIWSFLAKGDFEVDPQTKAQAQKDIAEDGYWGVEQTSQRIFDFAMALTNGDPEKMEKMRSAFEKGFKQATETWGKELPEISQKTYGATQKLFDDYKNSVEQGNVAVQ
ncbi:MAG: hypothetical protein J5842_08815 [Lachnospiraceae bacterium]|nr:hypothetical protein [Lachnospiraceae bacterium]